MGSEVRLVEGGEVVGDGLGERAGKLALVWEEVGGACSGDC